MTFFIPFIWLFETIWVLFFINFFQIFSIFFKFSSLIWFWFILCCHFNPCSVSTGKKYSKFVFAGGKLLVQYFCHGCSDITLHSCQSPSHVNLMIFYFIVDYSVQLPSHNLQRLCLNRDAFAKQLHSDFVSKFAYLLCDHYIVCWQQFSTCPY